MQAWITLLTQPDYVLGVRTLHQSLRDTQTRYPLVVMVTQSIDAATRSALTDEGCLVRDVAALSPAPGVAANYAHAHFAEVWTKLCAWNLTEFSRLVLLDADMLVVKNMDELMDLPLQPGWIAACHACRCNPNHIATYPADWVPANCHYTYGDGADDAAVPHGVAPYFNSGTVVLTPDKAIFADLQASLTAITDLSAFPFPEQDLLNRYFLHRWQPLSYQYNGLKTLSLHHRNIWDSSQVKNIHFILAKPWKYPLAQPQTQQDPYYPLITLWWQTAGALKPLNT
ncbi:glycosyltransferase family 8 protein [Acerihabitans sp. TG2]|uniref:glycosyltransferase family 8 protein n=1 Tax=Acerihabitans sp. TG2 TaxID=3096008 RepID=UPI002B23C0AD|nr:glycosyltransferase family 8 protein [Acerihabitans sp. TG2]MEA9393434.1 glycosyltransferase family 8 protein [Acerihabitans sp. TG2]